MKYDEMLFNKYQKSTLSRKEVAEELSISLSTLQRALDDGSLPIRFKRLGKSQKARLVVPIKSLADYLNFAA